MPPPFSAVLLAAGRSTRMGRDKGALELDGAPLWQRQRSVLVRAGAAELLLSARPEQPWVRAAAPSFAAVVPDSHPDCGPLAGITAALARASQVHLAVLAIDLPQMTDRWFATLLSACGPGVGAVGCRAGFFEPLAAIYPREMMPLAEAALARGELALQRLLKSAVAAGQLNVREINGAEAPLFKNWNEPG